MTGQHMGHTHVRGNAGGPDMSIQSLRDEDVTVAEVLKSAGYTNGLCGKWGLGDEAPGGRSGLPRRQGFDFFYGYLNQVHAHNYYPEFLWRNETRQNLGNEVKHLDRAHAGFRGGWATKRVAYSHDLIADEAMQFIRRCARRDAPASEPSGAAAKPEGQPFFLYLALTIPHANNEATRALGDGQEVPDYGQYAERPWSNPDKGQAAMISRMDASVGQILDLLKSLDIDNNTLVMFSSDNGPHDEGGHDTARFSPAGALRGMKRDLYEGGVRVPLIARWPGTTPAGVTSDHIGYFGDLMATAAELAGVDCPEDTDSISLVPTLTGDPQHQQQHPYLYWEFYEQGGRQAVRAGKWKAVRAPWDSSTASSTPSTSATQLFDLSQDLGEQHDLSAQYPQRVAELEAMMDQAHTAHPSWQVRGRKAPPKK